jgi:hypothetical protein
MGQEYWIGRKRAAMAMARNASTAESRLIHYELAGRYSIRAAQFEPFMIPRPGPATEGERIAIHPRPALRPPPTPRRDPDGSDAARGDER